MLKHDVFSRCDMCTRCAAIIQDASNDPWARAKAQEERELHWARVTTERRFVYSAHYLSLHESEGMLFAEIDGMDCAKTVLPHFHQYSKSVDKKRLLQLHLACVKYNGKQPDDVYYFTDAFPHDSANTITIMYYTVLRVSALQISFPSSLI